MHKQDVVYPYSGISLSNEKGTNTCHTQQWGWTSKSSCRVKDAGKKEYGSCVSTYLKAEVGGQGGRGDGLQRETRKGQDVLRRSIATVDSWGTDAEIDRRDTVKPEGLCIAKGPPPSPPPPTKQKGDPRNRGGICYWVFSGSRACGVFTRVTPGLPEICLPQRRPGGDTDGFPSLVSFCVTFPAEKLSWEGKGSHGNILLSRLSCGLRHID